MTNFSSSLLAAATLARARRTTWLAGLLLALLPLLAHAATPVLRLEATVTTGDVTAFVDRVEIIDATTGLPVRSAVTNAGFENTGSLGAGSYGYAPTGTGWAFVGSSGIATNSSAFGNPSAPEGTHVGLLQSSTPGAAISQTLPNLVPGLYRVRLRVAQRGTAPANQGVRVRVDGVDVGTVTPANDANFAMYNSGTFVVARPSVSGTFAGGAGLTTNGSTALDAGGYSVPTVTDVDNDGLLDLLVGNAAGNVLRYEQTTTNGTIFAGGTPLTTNGSTAIALGDEAKPAITDLDDDGLLDLLIGTSGGTLLRYEQTVANGSIFAGGTALTTNGSTLLYGGGGYVALTVTDVDGDGLLDLLVTSGSSNVLRFEQTTTNGSIFAGGSALTTNGTTALNTGGYSVPAVTDMDGDGLLDLLIGNSGGTLLRYEQTATNGSSFAAASGLVTNGGGVPVNGNDYTAPTVTDLDGDGLLDLLVGNSTGTIRRYEQAAPPTALALNPQAVAENAASGTVVGTFATTDATPGDTFTYTLVAGTGDADNASFAIGSGANAGKLVTAAVFDFETKSSYLVRVRTTDATGAFIEQAFTISITDVAEVPVLISFSPASGALGSTITLTGQYLTGLTSVLLGEVPALFTVVSNTSVTVTVPRQATSQKLRISRTSGLAANQGTAVSATAFQVTRPSTSSIFPAGSLTTNGTTAVNSDSGLAAPAVTDVDGDGLLDLLVGNGSGTVTRFEQMAANGSAFAPAGNLTTNGSTALSVGSFSTVATTDLDGDGLLDLLVGNNSGDVARFEQTTANGSVFAPAGNLTTDGSTALNAGVYSAPTVTDVDGDGLLDLLVGTINGTVTRFEQTTANGSVFASAGLITTNGSTALNVIDSAAPAVTDVDSDGLLDLLVGNNSATVTRFEQTTTNGGVFALVGNLTTDGSTDLAVGGYSIPAVTDLDGDGLLDLLVGGTDGTVSRFEQFIPATIASIAPATGVAGTTGVIITGTYLTGTTGVTVNGAAATAVTVIDDSHVRFTVPAGASNTQSITVAKPGGSSAAFTGFVVQLRPVATGTSPAANARTAPLTNSALAVGFTEAVSPASAANLKVFSAQAGGLKAGTVAVSGSTASYTSTLGAALRDFRPGETVGVTVPATVLGSGGLAATPFVYQFTTATTAGSGTFGTKADYGVIGPAPYTVALGDLNGDGLLDMVATSADAIDITVRLGTGAGGFGSATGYSPSSDTRGLAMGDLNGDGKLDAVVTRYFDDKVTVMMGNGTGGFVTGGDYGTGDGPLGATLGDLNGDGRLDLVVTNNSANSVSVLLGGGGSFGGRTDYVTGANPKGVALGDVNGDGQLDIVAANTGNSSFSVLLGTGGGSFGASTNYTVGSQPTGVALGDVNGDGRLDIVAANAGDNNTSVLLGTGAGGFGGQVLFATGASPQSVALGDVNGDGQLDIVTANIGGNSASVLLGSGTGSFAARADYATSAMPGSVALGDVNGDGRLDIATGNQLGDNVSVLLGLPPLPVITGIVPGTGVAGTTGIVITGLNLTGATGVTVNGAAATITANTATTVTISLPAGASATQSITVTTPGGTSAAYTGFGLRLQVAGTSPAANANAAPPASSAVAVTFTEPVTAASAATLKVFSAQLGGLKAGTVAVAGNTASFAAPAGTVRSNFAPGEVVTVTVPATVVGAGGLAARKRVYQFTTAVGGTGRGNFQPGSTLPVTSISDVVVADFNGDGIPDLADSGSGLEVRFGTGGGSYGAATVYAAFTAGSVRGLTAGDLNNDGFLDLAVANNAGPISVLQNNGTGGFTALANAASSGGSPRKPALGDLDGDGDLDLLVAHASGTVGVYLNNGSGGFAAPISVSIIGSASAAISTYVALGDVDNDGDLDFAATDFTNARVVVRLNDGSGTFSPGPNVAVGTEPNTVALADVNGDGSLDILTANVGVAALSVSLNNNDGTGSFAASMAYPLGATSAGLAVGDVDADGDLDVVTGSNQSAFGGFYLVLNSGNGTFGPASNIAASDKMYYLALADLDNDGDLDLAGAAGTGSSLFVRLNQPPLPTLTALGPAAELPGQPVVLTGTNFTSTSTVSFGGVAAASVTYTSPTSLTAVVPVGAVPGNRAVVVTTANGASASSPVFEVLQVYRSAAASGCLATASLTLTGSSGAWRYLRLAGVGGAVVAAIEDTQNLGTVTAGINALGTGTGTAVRQDGRAGRRYLDRNFYLTATNPTFTGSTVQVRFFGLTSELSRLTAVDGNATLASLNASQYDGLNQNCVLTDNDPTGERRLLAAPATVVAGADWFTAQVSVADHFSEFYLTGASSPLPVELLAFSATKQGPAVLLDWRTASEKNSARFEVERSRDGRTFEPIGTVAAQGSTARPTAYTFRDSHYPGETNLLYYRLHQVDLDGTASYSPVRAVTLDGKSQPVLYPSPARAGQLLTVTGLLAGTTVTVLDALGRQLLTAPVAADGTARFALPNGLAGGTYVLRSGAQAQRVLVE